MTRSIRFYDKAGQVRVLAEMCETCIFRPGNLMHLRPGRLAAIVKDHRAHDSNLVCHSTLPAAAPRGLKPALCRGHVDRCGPGQVLRIAQRLTQIGAAVVVIEVTPPAKDEVA